MAMAVFRKLSLESALGNVIQILYNMPFNILSLHFYSCFAHAFFWIPFSVVLQNKNCNKANQKTERSLRSLPPELLVTNLES